MDYFNSLQEAIAQNDVAKFIQIVKEYPGKRILLTAKGLLGKNGGITDEKDVLQYILTKVYQKGIGYFKDKDQGHFEAYLLTATKNACLNVFRAKKKNEKDQLLIVSTDLNEDRPIKKIAVNTDDLILGEELECKIAVLSDIQKTIIMMYLSGYNFDEIASKLGKKPSTIKYHKKAALERMSISNKAF